MATPHNHSWAECADLDSGLQPVWGGANWQLYLPYAFASHFAPQQMVQAIAMYRANFKPSAHHSKPHLMLGLNVFAANSDEKAAFCATSMQQAFVNLRSGRPAALPPPVKNCPSLVGPAALALLDSVLACSAIGTPGTVRDGLKAFIERTGADELMITTAIYDHAQRKRSYVTASGVLFG